MCPPENPPRSPKTESEIDEYYGLEPVIEVDSPSIDTSPTAEFVTVSCPYCGEAFETRADASAGSCTYVEDCQVCCQPIEMELGVDEDGGLREVVARRGDS
jgi:cysteine-rich CPXCG protein